MQIMPVARCSALESEFNADLRYVSVNPFQQNEICINANKMLGKNTWWAP